MVILEQIRYTVFESDYTEENQLCRRVYTAVLVTALASLGFAFANNYLFEQNVNKSIINSSLEFKF